MSHKASASLEGRTRPLAPSELDWPGWIPVVASVIPFGVAVDIVIRHGAFEETAAFGLPVIVVAAVAVLPWLIDVASAKLTGRFMPEWLFSVIVVVSVEVLIWQPTEVDPTPFLLVFLTGEMASRLSVRGGIAVAAASSIAMVTPDLLGRYDGAFIWLVGIGFGYFGGFALQSQIRLATERKLSEASLAQRAATEERQRIAREVHDVIAHSLSVTMLHVTAARMALERGQTGEALDSLREAERQGRSSLNDIRRTVGLLAPEESPTAPPAPAVFDLPKLVSDFRSAGLDVTLSINGEVRSLPAGAGLNLYRIVQESLTNIAKHAPGAAASVELDVTDEQIQLVVRNGPSNGAQPFRLASSGLGIKGMLERATMLGGSLAASPEGDGWVVLLTAPRVADVA